MTPMTWVGSAGANDVSPPIKILTRCSGDGTPESDIKDYVVTESRTNDVEVTEIKT